MVKKDNVIEEDCKVKENKRQLSYEEQRELKKFTHNHRENGNATK